MKNYIWVGTLIAIGFFSWKIRGWYDYSKTNHVVLEDTTGSKNHSSSTTKLQPASAKEEKKYTKGFTLVLPTPEFKGWITEVREEEEVVRYIWTNDPELAYIPTPKKGHLSPYFIGDVIYDGLVYDKLAAEKTKTTVDTVSLQIKHSWGVYSVKNALGKWDKITEEQFKTYARQFIAVRALSTKESPLSGWIDVPLKNVFD